MPQGYHNVTMGGLAALDLAANLQGISIAASKVRSKAGEKLIVLGGVQYVLDIYRRGALDGANLAGILVLDDATLDITQGVTLASGLTGSPNDPLSRGPARDDVVSGR